ncbi:MAG: HAMP domain-containing histidine kinase [Ruminiclostridium sp.]|nr:HAMP domain-containing histidine kinase [Ruminiclostridium sp.]
MKRFDRLIVLAAVMITAVFVIINAIPENKDSDVRLHTIEINRIVRVMTDTGEMPDPALYETITGIYPQTGDNSFYDSPNEYVIREINGKLYRIEYSEDPSSDSRLSLNVTAAFFAVFVLGLLLWLRQTVIKPFSRISELPYELAKGGLAVPLKESRSRYFGRFIWGLDMLREQLEQSKKSELELQKEKKTMLMSLSHDIKTPLSAIKLSAKALERGLYPETEKQRETAGLIAKNADDVEKLVNEIMHANSEDIIRFDVKNGEFYVSSVIDRIKTYYAEKLSGTEFTVDNCSDCILSGDPDRLAEVLQNVIENAIKYGDGHYIRIGFSDEEDCRLISVTNSGCTLPENELAHIFDSFWRGSNVGTQKGSGLGLSICRSLMAKMNGDVYAEISGGDMRVTLVCKKG